MRARAILALALPGLSQAYTVWSGSGDASNIAKWPTMTTTPVSVDIHDAGTTSPNATNAVNEILASFGNWEGVGGAAVQFDEGSWSGSHLTYGSDNGNGMNLVGFVLQDWPAGASSALAVTIVQGGGPIGGRFILEADIYINEDLYDWSDDGDTGFFDVRSVVTHEVGHFIGLDHTPITMATMYYAVGPGNTGPGTLHADDEEGARFLYPSPPPHTCMNNGQCPTILEFLDPDNTEIGTMLCSGGTCCLGMSCTGTSGNQGDPCYTDTDCAGGLHCPFDGDTCQTCGSQMGAFPDCGSPPSCPAMYECRLLESDDWCGNCLRPCNIQFECFADVAHCIDLDNGPGVNRRCVPDEVTGYYRCTISEPSQCPTGHACLRTTIGEICSNRGTVDFGDPCTIDTDCISLLCDRSMGDVCAQACGTGWPDCPAGHSCEYSTYFTFDVCQPWGAEPGPEPTPEPPAEPMPELAPDAGPDFGPDAPASPEPSPEPPPDEGCACAVGAKRPNDATMAPTLLALFAVLASRRRRRS